MTEVIVSERKPNRRAQSLGLDILPASPLEGFGAALEEAGVRNPTPSIARQLDRSRFESQFGPEDPAGMIGHQRPEPGVDFKVLTPEQANAKYGIEGELKFDDETPEPVAEQLNRLKQEELRRQDVLRRARSGIMTSVSAGLIASIVDPVNIASAFFPVVGPARYASLVARQGAGRARATVGAIEGTVGAAAVEPFVYFTAQSEQADYNEVDVLMNLAFGTALGAGLHLGAGALGDRIQARAQASRTQRQVDDLPRAEQEAVLRTAVAQLAEDRPVRVGPSLEAARRNLNERAPNPGETRQAIENVRTRMEERLSAEELKQIDDDFAFARFPDSETVAKATVPVESPFVVFRGADADRIIPEDTFFSASTDSRVGENFGRAMPGEATNKAVAEIEVSPGTRVATPDSGIEGEIVFDADTRFDILSRETVELDNGTTRTRIRARARPPEGAPDAPEPPRIVVERAIMDSIGEPHPEYQAATRAHAERFESEKGAPRTLEEEEQWATERLAEAEEMLDPEERTALADEFKDDDKLTRTYEKAWRLGATCRIRNGGN